MPRGPLGGPRPLSRCTLALQVTASERRSFSEDELTEHIQMLDRTFSVKRNEGRSEVVATVDNAEVIAGGKAAKFKISPTTMNKEQVVAVMETVEDYFGPEISTVAITLGD